MELELVDDTWGVNDDLLVGECGVCTKAVDKVNRLIFQNNKLIKPSFIFQCILAYGTVSHVTWEVEDGT